MTDVEAAYVGAMLDAEGTVSIRGKRGLIIIDNAEPELISAVLRATGLGIVHGYHPTNGHCLMLKWQVNRQADVYQLVQQLAPFSLKAQRVLEYIQPLMDNWTKRHYEQSEYSRRRTREWKAARRANP